MCFWQQLWKDKWGVHSRRDEVIGAQRQTINVMFPACNGNYMLCDACQEFNPSRAGTQNSLSLCPLMFRKGLTVKDYRIFAKLSIVSNHRHLDCLLNRFWGAYQRKHQEAPRYWPLQGEFTGHWWIPHTKGQWRGKCFHLMTSPCLVIKAFECIYSFWKWATKPQNLSYHGPCFSIKTVFLCLWFPASL